MENKKQDHMALIAIVGIVAIVGLFLMFFSQGTKGISTGTNGDLSGQAYAGMMPGGETLAHKNAASPEEGSGGSGGPPPGCYANRLHYDPEGGDPECHINEHFSQVYCPVSSNC